MRSFFHLLSLPCWRAAFVWVGVLGAGGALLGCRADSEKPGRAPSSESAAAAASASTQPRPAVTKPAVIEYSDPGNAGVVAYAKREGILERELAAVNAQIEWVPGPGSFSASFEAMNSGAINASGGAVSPIIGGLAHNLQFRIYAIADPGGARRAGVIAPAQSSIRKVSDLSGKRVAVNWAAHGDYILLRALQERGVPAAQVTRVPIQPPDAAAAFATGKIDAWSTFGVFFTTAVNNGAHIVVTEAELDSDDVGVLSAHKDILSQNPAAFQVLVRVIRDLTREGHREPEKFQNVFNDKGPRAVSGARLREDIEDTRTAPEFRVPTERDRVRVGNVMSLLHENGSIDRAIAVDQIVFDIDSAAATQGAAAPGAAAEGTTTQAATRDVVR